MSQFIIIAVDGPSASGKGTLARRLAEQFHLFYLDTGAIYRVAAKHILDTNGNPDNPDDALKSAIFVRDNLTFDMLSDPAIRTDKVADATSRSSRFPAVRDVLLDTQRRYAEHPPHSPHHKPYQGAVLDGRDIGTVVCPHALVKLYVTASTKIRAERRFRELEHRGIETSYETVLKEMIERDTRDSGRDTAPLKPADNAIILDTTHLDADSALDRAATILREKLV